MRLLIVGIVALALAVAGVSTYLIQSFGGEENLEELQKQAQKPQFRVLVAARILRPGEVLMPEGMTWLKWSEEALNPQFVTAATDEETVKKAKDFEGGVIRALVNQGEPILASKIFKTDDKAGFLAGVLAGGMRAVSMRASPNTATAGFILPGDRVDILMTHDKLEKAIKKKGFGKQKRSSKKSLKVLVEATETIMRDVRVIAVNQLTDLVEGQTILATTITVVKNRKARKAQGKKLHCENL
jgi:pilus assembly protein CpaB